MIHILDEDFISEETGELISVCKSGSGIMGTSLRRAHFRLGKILAQDYQDCFSNRSCVVSFMRSGIPFSLGIADSLDCPFLFYDQGKSDFFSENDAILRDKEVLFVDAVINSGKGMLEAIAYSGLPQKDIKILTNVLCAKSAAKLADYEVFAVRVSQNSFKGESVLQQEGDKGPDTGDRLFRTFCE